MRRAGGKFRSRRTYNAVALTFQCRRCFDRVPTAEVELVNGMPMCAACRVKVETRS